MTTKISRCMAYSGGCNAEAEWFPATGDPAFDSQGICDKHMKERQARQVRA